MKSSHPQNVGASVRQRLLNLAKDRGEEFQFVLTRFALERLLYRLATTEHPNRFLLKGALLFAVWSHDIYRPTRDLDLAATGEAEPERMAEVFRELCQAPSSSDGLSFDPASVRAERIREIHQYPGVRVELVAHLAGARIPLQVDIGYGDAVTPRPCFVDYPTLLDHPAPRLKAYSQETFVAEKFQAMVLFGIANTRIKDFYDLWVLATSFNFTGSVLSLAISATFERRQTLVPIETPVALTAEFSGDRPKQTAWRNFMQRISRDGVAQIELSEVCSLLEGFLMPPSQAAASGKTFEAEWTVPGPWLVKRF